MQMEKRRIEIRVDRYTQVCLSIIAVLLTVVIIGLWAGDDLSPEPAAAQEVAADQTAQKLLAAQEKTNATLEQVIAVLRSGDVKVQLMKRPPAPEKGGR